MHAWPLHDGRRVVFKVLHDGASAKFKRLMAQKMPEFKARWHY